MDIEDTAKRIASELQATFPRCMFNVVAERGAYEYTIAIELLAAPQSPLTQPSTHRVVLNPWAIGHGLTEEESVRALTPEGLTLMRRIVSIVLSHRKSKAVDTTAFFRFNLAIGGWDESFRVTE